MVLLALAFAGCRGKSSQLADFNKQLYAPEYASGFKIERADGRQSVLVSVMNPWQGADSVTTGCSSPVTGNPFPRVSTGRSSKGMRSASWRCPRPISPCSTPSARRHVWSAFRDSTISPIPTFRARRDSIGDVGYEGNINYELLLSLDPDLVLLFGVNGASAMESQTQGARHPVHVCRRLSRRISAGQSRMAGGAFGGRRETREGRKGIRGYSDPIQCAETESVRCRSRCPVGHAQYALRRFVVHALDGKLCRAADYRRPEATTSTRRTRATLRRLSTWRRHTCSLRRPICG